MDRRQQTTVINSTEERGAVRTKKPEITFALQRRSREVRRTLECATKCWLRALASTTLDDIEALAISD